MQITLHDGSTADLAEFGPKEIDQLHWDQERAFASRIRQSPKGSEERAFAFRDGYDTVTQILAWRDRATERGLVMGYNPRYVRLVTKLLRRHRHGSTPTPRFFEIGYGSGAMLEAVVREGFDVGGVEVSSFMQQQAMVRLPEPHHAGLLLGDFLTMDLAAWQGTHVAYWNDVLEHLPQDESLDFVRRVHDLLAPGGVLVTITPNWHMRPMDVTSMMKPPRSEAEGFHLKEHTLGEVRDLLRRAGFARVATPLFVTRQTTALFGNGLCGVKCLIEPALERLPFRLAALACRGGGLTTTLAWK